jgi:hypothetical protein
MANISLNETSVCELTTAITGMAAAGGWSQQQLAPQSPY